jgi:hypothetical protein
MFLLLLGISGGAAATTEVSTSDRISWCLCSSLSLFPLVLKILLAGITGALAGAISMGLSEFIGVWPCAPHFVVMKRCFLQQLRAKKKLLTVILSSKRSTSNTTAMLNSLKYALSSHISQKSNRKELTP